MSAKRRNDRPTAEQLKNAAYLSTAGDPAGGGFSRHGGSASRVDLAGRTKTDVFEGAINSGEQYFADIARHDGGNALCSHSPSQRILIEKPGGGFRTIDDPAESRRLEAVVLRAELAPYNPALTTPGMYGRSSRLPDSMRCCLRPGASTQDHMGCRVLQLLRRGFTFVVCVDLRDAFPLLAHKAITRSLQDAGVPTNFTVRALDCVRVHTRNRETGKLISLKDVGIEQGSPLSPTIFNGALAPIFREIESEECRVLSFIDDIYLLCNRREIAVSMFRKLWRIMHECGFDNVRPLADEDDSGKATRIVDATVEPVTVISTYKVCPKRIGLTPEKTAEAKAIVRGLRVSERTYRNIRRVLSAQALSKNWIRDNLLTYKERERNLRHGKSRSSTLCASPAVSAPATDTAVEVTVEHLIHKATVNDCPITATGQEPHNTDPRGIPGKPPPWCAAGAPVAISGARVVQPGTVPVAISGARVVQPGTVTAMENGVEGSIVPFNNSLRCLSTGSGNTFRCPHPLYGVQHYRCGPTGVSSCLHSSAVAGIPLQGTGTHTSGAVVPHPNRVEPALPAASTAEAAGTISWDPIAELPALGVLQKKKKLPRSHKAYILDLTGLTDLAVAAAGEHATRRFLRDALKAVRVHRTAYVLIHPGSEWTSWQAVLGNTEDQRYRRIAVENHKRGFVYTLLLRRERKTPARSVTPPPAEVEVVVQRASSTGDRLRDWKLTVSTPKGPRVHKKRCKLPARVYAYAELVALVTHRYAHRSIAVPAKGFFAQSSTLDPHTRPTHPLLFEVVSSLHRTHRWRKRGDWILGEPLARPAHVSSRETCASPQ